IPTKPRAAKPSTGLNTANSRKSEDSAPPYGARWVAVSRGRLPPDGGQQVGQIQGLGAQLDFVLDPREDAAGVFLELLKQLPQIGGTERAVLCVVALRHVTQRIRR